MTQRHLRSKDPRRWLSRTLVALHAERLRADPANALRAFLLDLIFSVFVFASRHLIIEVLRRPIEFTQYLSIRYTDRLLDAGIEPSVRSVGDSYDNAMAESVIGLYKTEVIRRKGPWRSIEAVEYATLEWVDWFNHRRLLEPIGYLPPLELEAGYYEHQPSAIMVAGLM